LTTRLRHSSVSAVADARPPSATARKIGPLLISATASQRSSASTGRSPRHGDLLPLPFLVGLRSPDHHAIAVGDRDEILDPQGA
jgi:hypothetical protein